MTEPREVSRSWVERVGIGKLAVSAAFAAMVAAWIVALRAPAAYALRDVFMAGFVGGFTNTIAIRMLFTRVWYLPGSGVLLNERDAIIRSLADTLERHILNPELVEEKVRAFARDLDKARLAAGLNAVVDELRPDLVAYLRSPAQRARIQEAVRDRGGFWGGMADAVGLVTFDEVADRLTEALVEQIQAFEVDAAMVEAALEQVGSVDELLLQPDNPVILRHYGTSRSAAQVLFEKLDARQLVVERLSTYPAERVRDIVAENVREHMGWLEVFGVLLGMALAALAAVIDALA